MADTSEIVLEISGAITQVLKDHGITHGGVGVKIGPEQIRIIVSLEDEE